MKYKNIIIISYLFPPLNQIGAKRAYYFAKYLSLYGFNVTVISSELPENHSVWEADCSFFKVIRFPVNRVSLFSKKKIDSKFGKLFRTIDFFLSPIESEYRILFDINVIKKPDFIISTGGPWQSFEIAVHIKKKFNNSKLIFDYRDPWNVKDESVSLVGLNSFNDNLLGYIKSKWNILKEKKILLNASAITSVSEAVLNNTMAIVGNKTPNRVIFNGFDDDDKVYTGSLKKMENEFWISYTGVLREEQNRQMFISAIEKLFDDYTFIKKNIRIKFIGSENSNFDTIKIFKTSKYFKYFSFTPFINRNAVKQIQANSDILLHFSHENKKGIITGKIFEYLAVDKPILLVSQNHDVIENLIINTKTGVICKNENEIENTILKWYTEWKENGSISHISNKVEKLKYTYKNQTKALVDFLKQL